MKRIFFPLSLVFLVLVFAGCSSIPAEDRAPAVDPAILVGTKWIEVHASFGVRNTLEFIDEATCIYTFFGEAKNHAYKITGNKLILEGSDTYTIQGNTLLLRGYPYWAKE